MSSFCPAPCGDGQSGALLKYAASVLLGACGPAGGTWIEPYEGVNPYVAVAQFGNYVGGLQAWTVTSALGTAAAGAPVLYGDLVRLSYTSPTDGHVYYLTACADSFHCLGSNSPPRLFTIAQLGSNGAAPFGWDATSLSFKVLPGPGSPKTAGMPVQFQEPVLVQSAYNFTAEYSGAKCGKDSNCCPCRCNGHSAFTCSFGDWVPTNCSITDDNYQVALCPSAQKPCIEDFSCGNYLSFVADTSGPSGSNGYFLLPGQPMAWTFYATAPYGSTKFTQPIQSCQTCDACCTAVCPTGVCPCTNGGAPHCDITGGAAVWTCSTPPAPPATSARTWLIIGAVVLGVLLAAALLYFVAMRRR